MGRRLDWLLYGTPPSPRPRSSPPAGSTIEAAARVALARRRGRSSLATTPFGFGPPLAGFEPPYPFTAPGWFDRSAAMSVASISRSRDLICSAVSALPFTLWTVDRNVVPSVERRVPDITWMERPDPDRTRQWMLAWTTDDLIFHAIAHWHITARFADTGFPRTFRRIEPGDLHDDGDGALSITDPYTGERVPIRDEDVVEFLSPIEGMLSNGWRTISIAMQLDEAADRFASNEIPNGWLQERDGSEDMSSEDLQAEALNWSVARHTNTTAALNKYLEYHPNVVDASAMQLVEGRSYQALEAARLGNVPPYLVGAPAGTGMTYQNGQQARQDLVDFGAAAFIGCIEQTLSGPNVTPRGQAVRLDLNAWLRNPFTTSTDSEPGPNDLQVADPATDTTPTQEPLTPPTEVPT